MADYFHTTGHLGEVWMFLMQWWEAHATDTTLDAGADLTTVTFGGTTYLAYKIPLTDDSGLNNHYFAMLDTVWGGSSGLLPVTYLNSLPGWNYIPKAVPLNVGSRHNYSFFQVKMWGLKQYFVTHSCGYTYSYNGVGEGNQGEADTYNQLFWSIYASRQGLVMVMQGLMTSNFTDTYQLLDNNNQTNPYPIGVPGSGGGGGSTIDITPLTDAVRAIALQDYDIEINNGAAMFSLRSKTRVS